MTNFFLICSTLYGFVFFFGCVWCVCVCVGGGGGYSSIFFNFHRQRTFDWWQFFQIHRGSSPLNVFLKLNYSNIFLSHNFSWNYASKFIGVPTISFDQTVECSNSRMNIVMKQNKPFFFLLKKLVCCIRFCDLHF